MTYTIYFIFWILYYLNSCEEWWDSFWICSLNLLIRSQNEDVECLHIILCINVSIFVEEVKEIMSSMSNIEFWECHATFKIIFNLLISTNISQKGKKLLRKHQVLQSNNCCSSLEKCKTIWCCCNHAIFQD